MLSVCIYEVVMAVRSYIYLLANARTGIKVRVWNVQNYKNLRKSRFLWSAFCYTVLYLFIVEMAFLPAVF